MGAKRFGVVIERKQIAAEPAGLRTTIDAKESLARLR